jgi:hypothetical protein
VTGEGTTITILFPQSDEAPTHDDSVLAGAMTAQ